MSLCVAACYPSLGYAFASRVLVLVLVLLSIPSRLFTTLTAALLPASSPFTAPYEYFAATARKPPDIEAIETVIATTTLLLIPTSLGSTFAQDWWRIFKIPSGWLTVPPAQATAASDYSCDPSLDDAKSATTAKRIVLASIQVFTIAALGTRMAIFNTDGATVVLDNWVTGNICNAFPTINRITREVAAMSWRFGHVATYATIPTSPDDFADICLDARLQPGPMLIPKWQRRARLGVYFGHSAVHAGSVALALNLATGHVSPQPHCVFDDDITTVPLHWAELCAICIDVAINELYVLSIFEENMESPDATTPRYSTLSHLPSSAASLPFTNTAADEVDATTSLPGTFGTDSAGMQSYPLPNTTASAGQGHEEARTLSRSTATSRREGDRNLLMPSPVALDESGLRRSTRSSRSTERFDQEYGTKGSNRAVNFMFVTFCMVSTAFVAIARSLPTPRCYALHLLQHYEQISMHFDATINRMHTAAFVFATEVGQNDVFTYKDITNPTSSAALLPSDFHAVDEVGATPSSPGFATAGTQSIPATTTAPFQPRIAEVTFHPQSIRIAQMTLHVSQCHNVVEQSLRHLTAPDSAGMQRVQINATAPAQPRIADATSDLSSDHENDLILSQCRRAVTTTQQAGHISASPPNLSCASRAQVCCSQHINASIALRGSLQLADATSCQSGVRPKRSNVGRYNTERSIQSNLCSLSLYNTNQSFLSSRGSLRVKRD